MARNPLYEQHLKLQGLSEGKEWNYLDKVPLAEIDLIKSQRNQAREQAINEEQVGRFMADKRAGYVFPALVGRRISPRGKFVLLDGNHRAVADTRLGRKEVDMYLVLSEDQKIIDRLCWTFNEAVNGTPLTDDERMDHAIEFVKRYKVSVAYAAKEWKVSAHNLGRKLRHDEMMNELVEAGVKVPTSIPIGVMEELGLLRPCGIDVFSKAVEAVVTSGGSIKDAETVVRNVRRASTSAEKLQAVEEYANRPSVVEKKLETKGGRVKPQTGRRPSERFEDYLGKILRLKHEFPANILRATGENKKQQLEDVRELVEWLMQEFIGGLGRLHEAEKKEVS